MNSIKVIFVTLNRTLPLLFANTNIIASRMAAEVFAAPKIFDVPATGTPGSNAGLLDTPSLV